METIVIIVDGNPVEFKQCKSYINFYTSRCGKICKADGKLIQPFMTHNTASVYDREITKKTLSLFKLVIDSWTRIATKEFSQFSVKFINGDSTDCSLDNLQTSFSEYDYTDIIDYRPVPGYEALMASKYGEIIDTKLHIKYRQYTNSSGYYLINYLSVDRRREPLATHRLVALAWVHNPNPDLLHYVNHKDGKKLNNKENNLEWTTHRDNIAHARNTGLKENCSVTYIIKVNDKLLKFYSTPYVARYLKCEYDSKYILSKLAKGDIPYYRSENDITDDVVVLSNGEEVNLTNLVDVVYQEDILIYNIRSGKVIMARHPTEAKSSTGINQRSIINACNTRRTTPLKLYYFMWADEWSLGYRFPGMLKTTVLQ